MAKRAPKKVQTDADVKKKAVKLVIAHMKRKLPEDTTGLEHVTDWIADMEEVLNKDDEFDMVEYIEMRRILNDVIERTLDEELRYKLRDSWYSFGKALERKAKRY
jgi:hypothetical protein